MNECAQPAAVVKTLGIVVGLLFLCACQYDPYTLSYATSKPDLKEIIGHGVATDATLRELARGPYQKARPVIDVSEDGSIPRSTMCYAVLHEDVNDHDSIGRCAGARA